MCQFYFTSSPCIQIHIDMRIEEIRRLINEAMANAYEILGVPRHATAEQVKSAFRQKAMETHPDKNPGDPTALERSQQVSLAYGILSNPRQRARLDNELAYYGGASQTPRASQQTHEDPWAKARREWEQNRSSPPPGQQRKAQWRQNVKARQARQARARDQKAKANNSQASSAGDYVFGGWKYYVFLGSEHRSDDFGGSSWKSRKFWGYKIDQSLLDGKPGSVHVKWGKIGTPGQTLAHMFGGMYSVNVWIQKMRRSKLQKGYRSAVSDPTKSEEKNTTQTKQQQSKTQAGPTSKGPSNKDTSTGEKTYRVYGSPTHIRYKTKMYKAIPGTKFKKNDRARVSQSGEKSINVKDQNSDHTQTWRQEAIASVIDRLVIEHIVDVMNSVI